MGDRGRLTSVPCSADPCLVEQGVCGSVVFHSFTRLIQCLPPRSSVLGTVLCVGMYVPDSCSSAWMAQVWLPPDACGKTLPACVWPVGPAGQGTPGCKSRVNTVHVLTALGGMGSSCPCGWSPFPKTAASTASLAPETVLRASLGLGIRVACETPGPLLPAGKLPGRASVSRTGLSAPVPVWPAVSLPTLPFIASAA